MLKVKVTKKFYDKNGQLLGYMLQDETNATRSVYKDQLKNAIASGQVECVNMTMTSDGRLIGRAKPDPKHIKQPASDLKLKHVQAKPTQAQAQPVAPVQQSVKSGVIAKAIITNGKKIGGSMVDYTEYNKINGITPDKYQELPLGQSFNTGIETEKYIKDGWYSNISAIDGKIDFSNTKKVSYSKLKDKLIKILVANGVKPEFKVEKASNNKKYEYTVAVEGVHSNEMIQIVYVLVENEMIIAKNKVLSFGDNHTVDVECITGINDVRKALKNIKLK